MGERVCCPRCGGVGRIVVTVGLTCITAMRKHDIHDDLTAALIDAGWTPPRLEGPA